MWNPDPIGNIAFLRRTFRSIDNHSFPATDPANEFKQAIQNETAFNVPTDIFQNAFPPFETNLDVLLQTMTSNGAIAAEGYSTDLRHWFSDLYGIPQASETRKTTVLHQAVYGLAAAIASVNENTGKGWLHNHLLAFVGPPHFVRSFANGHPAFQASYFKYLDSVQQCDLSEAQHLQSLLRRVHGLAPCRTSWLRTPSLLTTPDLYDAYVFQQVDRTNIHALKN